MEKTQLIIVEGLPGSGKSTTADKIAKTLRRNGERVVCVDEGAPDHPADYDRYDFPDFAAEREQILKKWEEFVRKAEEGTTYVFNCIFLQNPMCETMMRFGMREDGSQKYICEIADIIRPVDPFILYLERSDVKHTVERVLEERGNDWLQGVIEYHVKQGYGKSEGLSGFDGYISCLEERQRRELRILQSAGLRYLVLSGSITDNDLDLYFGKSSKYAATRRY